MTIVFCNSHPGNIKFYNFIHLIVEVRGWIALKRIFFLGGGGENEKLIDPLQSLFISRRIMHTVYVASRLD